jgi:NAD(P)-dependent dehydrogenase (short-subunit alcohol dehydrogenase family)
VLNGKICLVTGSADGIGRATAVEMAEQGAGGVMVCDINDEKGAETVEMIRAKGVEADYQHCDMAKPDEIRALIDATVERFGGLDVLHNNAGVHESDFTTDLNVETLPEEI